MTDVNNRKKAKYTGEICIVWICTADYMNK